MPVDGLNFFSQLIIILGFSIPVIYVFNKIKLPSIIGFLITGIIIGPFGLRLIDDTAGIQFLIALRKTKTFEVSLKIEQAEVLEKLCLTGTESQILS